MGNVRPENFDCSQGGSAQKGIFGPFGIVVLADDLLQEQTAIFFYITPEVGGQWSTRVCSDQSRSSMASGLDESVYGSYVTTLPTENELTMRILVSTEIAIKLVRNSVAFGKLEDLMEHISSFHNVSKIVHFSALGIRYLIY